MGGADQDQFAGERWHVLFGMGTAVAVMIVAATAISLLPDLVTFDMRACLRIVRWEHCAVGGAADPEHLTSFFLLDGFDEGNVARMYGFDALRVLRKTEVWSGQR